MLDGPQITTVDVCRGFGGTVGRVLSRDPNSVQMDSLADGLQPPDVLTGSFRLPRHVSECGLILTTSTGF